MVRKCLHPLGKSQSLEEPRHARLQPCLWVASMEAHGIFLRTVVLTQLPSPAPHISRSLGPLSFSALLCLAVCIYHTPISGDWVIPLLLWNP